MHWIVWEFQVGPNQKREFETVYGPQGEWARLFEHGEGYLGTVLLRDPAAPGRYFTIDRWRSPADYEAFRARWGDAYEQLDRRCAELTEREVALGSLLELHTAAGGTIMSENGETVKPGTAMVPAEG
jgi:heme-degrading monooxygenase HmoA